MNYIRHLTAFYNHVKKDDCLTASHISLYMALFQYWNFNRFQNPFPVYRQNIMNLSKIGSKNTYHKCIKELHQAKYIYYHPSPSKFLPVKVSIGRLDVQEEPVSRFKQLDLFNENESMHRKPSPPQKGEDLRGGPSPKIDTDSVPILTAMCTDFDTVPVPKMGHNIKHKHFNKTESKPPSQKIFDKNEKISQEINRLAGVPNSVHQTHPSPVGEGLGVRLAEVEQFFKSANYPEIEAKKFFNHYKAIGWKIKGITPIEDWEAAAHKWMINAKQWDASGEDKSPSLGGGFRDRSGAEVKDLKYLYESFLEGHNIFKFILPEHFTELNLELTEEIMQQAWTERINQLTGTNQHSLNQLWDAYLHGNEKNELLIKDKSNLINLAKRIAVIKHFQKPKLSS